MPTFFEGHVPDVLYHGTQKRESLDGPCPPASESRMWNKISWRTYDRFDEEARLAYANVVYEALGLRDPARVDAPEWAKNIRSIDALSKRIGIMFVTDDRKQAESLYGPTVEIDMNDSAILDAVRDPNTMTHRAWILVLKPGAPLPLLQPAPTPSL